MSTSGRTRPRCSCKSGCWDPVRLPVIGIEQAQKLLAVANDLARKLPKFELVVASWSADSR
jgi:hypothetical protein